MKHNIQISTGDTQNKSRTAWLVHSFHAISTWWNGTYLLTLAQGLHSLSVNIHPS